MDRGKSAKDFDEENLTEEELEAMYQKHPWARPSADWLQLTPFDRHGKVFPEARDSYDTMVAEGWLGHARVNELLEMVIARARWDIVIPPFAPLPAHLNLLLFSFGDEALILRRYLRAFKSGLERRLPREGGVCVFYMGGGIRPGFAAPSDRL